MWGWKKMRTPDPATKIDQRAVRAIDRDIDTYEGFLEEDLQMLRLAQLAWSIDADDPAVADALVEVIESQESNVTRNEARIEALKRMRCLATDPEISRRLSDDAAFDQLIEEATQSTTTDDEEEPDDAHHP
ncbi:hypothetical protein [Microbacterium sp.]|uniref:hypothetical protein n=1 Tax=Microbacterium sp. TaxID=51671 RepID=UPI00333FDFFE